MRFLSPILAVALAVTYALRVVEIIPDRAATYLVGFLALALIVSTTVQAVRHAPQDGGDTSV